MYIYIKKHMKTIDLIIGMVIIYEFIAR